MRKYIKKEIFDLLNTLLKADKSIKKAMSAGHEQLMGLLQDCQDAAISVGNSIEKSEGEGTDAVKHLENYCELLYKFSTGEEKATYKLDTCINACINEIKQLPERIEAVFLPYKASMWDSLESVWMAADADPDCDAYVIPIPYYDKNPDGSFAKMNYEINQYPDYVPVIRFEEYDLSEHHPDMIFIHNPYDECNFVTSVHPNYYSGKLKEYTDCLVYVPYYATSGKIAEGHDLLPSYVNMDYIIVQSKEVMEQFDPMIRHKILPLGSPKFDRVIRLSKNPPEPPEEWREKMAGKRVYFYNTSIAGMLRDTRQFLNKLKYVFETFKNVDDACLLWRPHPLLQSTFESMRLEYLEEYENLKKYFENENIGIYDTNPDIDLSIAQSFAYIGDSGTSVISLFQAASKPIYILNNEITEEPPEGWWKDRFYYCPAGKNRNNKYIVMPENKLFWDPNNTMNYEFYCDLPCNREVIGYSKAIEIGNKAYIIPSYEQNILILSPDKKFEKIELKHHDVEKQSFVTGAFYFDKYIVLIPNEYPDIVVFDIESKKIRYISGYRDLFWIETEDTKIFSGLAALKKQHSLFCVNNQNHRLYAIDLESLIVKEKPFYFDEDIVGIQSENYYEENILWAFPLNGSRVKRLEIDKEEMKEYELLEDSSEINNCRKDDLSRNRIFSSMAKLGNKILFCPNNGEKFMEMDIHTNVVKEWGNDIKCIYEDNGESFVSCLKGYFTCYDNGELKGFFNRNKKEYFIYSEENNQFDEKCFFSEKEIIKTYSKGFYQEENIYSCIESNWNPLYRFISNEIIGDGYEHEINEKQFLKINGNISGNSGLMIYKKARI